MVESDESPLPESVLEDVERLTRLARASRNDPEREAYRQWRTSLLDAHGYRARVRTEDETLVCYPTDWIEDGTVQVDRIDDRSAAVEIPLAEAGDPDDWEAVDAENRAIVAAIEEAHESEHAANAKAFADFMGNHRARPIASATAADVEVFLDDYYVRNAWPSPEERAIVTDSLALVFDAVDRPVPAYTDPRPDDRST